MDVQCAQLGLLELKFFNFWRLTDVLAYLSCAVSLAVLVRRYRARKYLLPLPPCPPKQGGLDHSAIMPKAFEYLAYEKWATELDTDIIHLQLGKKVLVILSSWEAISDILEKHSLIYSDRSQDTMKSKVVGYDWPLSSLPFGERWRRSRALFQKHLHPFNIKLFQPRQLAFIRGRLLPQFLEGPTDIISVVRHFTAGLAFSVAYGIEIQAKNDPFVHLAEKAMSSVVQLAIPGKYLVDEYPLLRFVPSWFPGAGWKRQGLIWRKWQEDTRSKAFNVAMESISSGTIRPSFVEEAVQAYGDASPDLEQLELIKDVAAIIFGGADTTASAINTFIVTMLCHPEIQEKARDELDRVIGPNRLPTFEDKKDLPYITAIMKESLRWQNPTPVAVPHMSSEEGHYKGYRIPKGALVFGNIWALMHDPEEFPDPMKYKPERFLNPDGSLKDETVRDPTTAVFGFGRRLCPGRHIALSALWMTIASILAAFKIEKGIGDDGESIEPEPKFLSGFARLPAPFRATLKVRSKELEIIIQNGEALDL